MMNAKEKEYMDYLIHNRTELTNQITRHLDEIVLLQKKLDIATKALEEYTTNESYKLCIVYCHYGKPVHASDVAIKALKEIDLVGTSAKEEE